MTETGYLYEYFLKNSEEDDAPSQEENQEE